LVRALVLTIFHHSNALCTPSALDLAQHAASCEDAVAGLPAFIPTVAESIGPAGVSTASSVGEAPGPVAPSGTDDSSEDADLHSRATDTSDAALSDDAKDTASRPGDVSGSVEPGFTGDWQTTDNRAAAAQGIHDEDAPDEDCRKMSSAAAVQLSVPIPEAELEKVMASVLKQTSTLVRDLLVMAQNGAERLLCEECGEVVSHKSSSSGAVRVRNLCLTFS